MTGFKHANCSTAITMQPRAFIFGIYIIASIAILTWRPYFMHLTMSSVDLNYSNSHDLHDLQVSSVFAQELRWYICNGCTNLQLGRSLKYLILFKYMPFRDDPPHRFSQFLLIWFYKQDWKKSLYSY